MKNCKVLSGLTDQTAQSLLLDAGAFFKNYEIGKDTFETAVIAKKLLGATKGGGSFKAIPSTRQPEIDGMRGMVKDLSIVDSWEVSMSAKLVEVTAENILLGLGVATKVAGDTDTSKYEVIQGKHCIDVSDYIENITWVGNLSGTDEPVVIQIYNALNTKGLELGVEDKGEAVIEMEFAGHYDLKAMQKVPFAIYYPKITA